MKSVGATGLLIRSLTTVMAPCTTVYNTNTTNQSGLLSVVVVVVDGTVVIRIIITFFTPFFAFLVEDLTELVPATTGECCSIMSQIRSLEIGNISRHYWKKNFDL